MNDLKRSIISALLIFSAAVVGHLQTQHCYGMPSMSFLLFLLSDNSEKPKV